MEDCAIAARQAVRDAITPLGAKLYTDERSEAGGKELKWPHAWLYSEDESDGRLPFQSEDVVVLHLYARSKRGVANLEDAVAFLDDYWPGTYGNAVSPHYKRQSKPREPEGDGAWHTTARYLVMYTDLRKFQTA